MIILFVLLTCAARAKGDEASDPVYDKIWKELVHTNWALTISSADSLIPGPFFLRNLKLYCETGKGRHCPGQHQLY